ncbi:MAG: hypothetical protein AAB337_03435 [Patescibacteria group bacterium]|mgnify:CR=1 FL=1
MEEAPQQLQMPQGVKPTGQEEVAIYTMPAEFRGGKTLMTPVSSAVSPPELKVVIPPPVKKVLGKPKRLVSPVLLIAGGILFLAIVGLAAYLLLSMEQVQPIEEIEVVVEPSVVVEEPVVDEEEEEPVEPQPGTDQDSDGLTNTEEILFGSDPRNPDTDEDTFLDGNEVYHLYNPRGSEGVLLTDAGFAREFGAEELSYSVIFPSRWTALTGDTQTEEMLFRAPTGEQIRVSVVARTASFDLSDASLSQTTTKKGYPALLSKDKRTTYIPFGDLVYIVSYELNDAITINFLTTYQMMVNSLDVTTYEPED